MYDTIGQLGLVFFGTVTASISHELKNRLAVIKEHAGLLNDFMVMAAQGRQLDIDRIQKLADALSKQVELSDAIIKNMNRFAHSTDEIKREIDIGEVIQLVVALSKRSAEMHRVRLKISDSIHCHTVTTIPFLLMNLLWTCIDVLVNTADGDGTIEFAVQKVPEERFLILMAMDWPAPQVHTAVITEMIRVLAEAIGARVFIKQEEMVLAVDLPPAQANPHASDSL